MPADFHIVYESSTNSTWIADGNRLVARLQPPRLQNLVLHPGGPELVTWLTLFWWQYASNEQPGRSAWLVDRVVYDENPDCFRVTVHSHNTDRSVLSECVLALTLDEKIGSYVYDVHTSLKIASGKTWIVQPQGGVEFVNPWCRDAVGSAYDFEGSETPLWKWVVYSHSDGRTVRLPLNHLGSPLLERIRFPESGGWLGFFSHARGNPVIELDAETARLTRAEVCAWGYDLHLIQRIPGEPPWEDKPLEEEGIYPAVVLSEGQKLTAHYRLYGLSEEASLDLLARSVQIALPGHIAGRLTRPAFTYPASDFQKGIDPATPDSSWYWSPSHPHGVTWEREVGRLDSASLHVYNETDRLAYWEVPLGPDFWMSPLYKGRQRISAWIRVCGVLGKGAYIAYRYSSYSIETGQEPRLVECTSAYRTGEGDWERFEMEVESPPPHATRAYLRLALCGQGEAWFDDLLVEHLP